MFLGWILVFFFTVLLGISIGCKDNEIDINLKGEACTVYSCIGNCTFSGQCCLEKCFDTDPMDDQRFVNCSRAADEGQSCKNFENLTHCIAEVMNSTFDICWRHIMHHVNQRAAAGANFFSPLICPCEWNTARKHLGRCWLPQCKNNTLCTDQRDTILNQDVCCINKTILAKEEDCESDEKFQAPVDKYLNVSTQLECMEICENGFCRVPDASRIPACCRRTPVHARPKPADDSLHGGVVAVIVIIIIVLIMVGALVILYIYRLKQDEAHRILQKQKEDKIIEMTGLEELVEREEDGEGPASSGKYTELAWNGEVRAPEPYTALRYTRSHSTDELRNGTAQIGVSNDAFRDNESYDEEQSYETYRRRMHALAREREASGDNVKYVFDDGLGHSSEEDEYRA